MEKVIHVTPEGFAAPCHMAMCRNLVSWSIHDILGRPQTGLMVCDDCLKAIVAAGAAALDMALVPLNDQQNAIETDKEVAFSEQNVNEVSTVPVNPPSIMDEGIEGQLGLNVTVGAQESIFGVAPIESIDGFDTNNDMQGIVGKSVIVPAIDAVVEKPKTISRKPATKPKTTSKKR